MDTISREPTTVAVMLVEEFMNPTIIIQHMLAEELGLSIERVRAICEGIDRINCISSNSTDTIISQSYT